MVFISICFFSQQWSRWTSPSSGQAHQTSLQYLRSSSISVPLVLSCPSCLIFQSCLTRNQSLHQLFSPALTGSLTAAPIHPSISLSHSLSCSPSSLSSLPLQAPHSFSSPLPVPFSSPLSILAMSSQHFHNLVSPLCRCRREIRDTKGDSHGWGQIQQLRTGEWLRRRQG